MGISWEKREQLSSYFPDESPWLGDVLMLVTKDTAALHWLLAVLSLLFLCSWFFMLVVFYALRADVVHTIPWAVLGALLFCGLVYAVLKLVRLVHLENYNEASPLLDSPTLSPRAAFTASPGGFAGGFHSPRDAAGLPLHRVVKVDYAKLLVVSLVMLHHLFDVMYRNHEHHSQASFWFHWYDLFNTPWMIPLLAFCSGMVDSSLVSDRRTDGVLQLLSGCLICQGVYMLFLKYCLLPERPVPKNGDNFDVRDFVVMPNGDTIEHEETALPMWRILEHLTHPFYHLWYLYALVAWRVLLPFVLRLKFPVVTAGLLSAVSGFLGAEGQLLYRVLGYLPFFVAGAVVRRHEGCVVTLLQLTSKPDVKKWALAVLLAHFLLSLFGTNEQVCTVWFDRAGEYRSSPCSAGEPLDGASVDFDHSPDASRYWIDMWAVVCGHMISSVLALAVAARLPEAEYPLLAEAGARTLAPYVFHVVLLVVLKAYTGWCDDNSTFLEVLLVSLLMMVQAVVMYIPMVNDALTLFIQPPVITKSTIEVTMKPPSVSG